MPTVFTRIMNHELPGRIVHEDAQNVAFLTIAPIKPGHTLVVPRLEIEHWIDLPDEASASLWATAAVVGRALDTVFRPKKVGAMLLGLEVPHVHIHLLPINAESEADFRLADQQPDPAQLDDVAERIRRALA
ncbi:MAG: HIT family protein [Frankia sp.]